MYVIFRGHENSIFNHPGNAVFGLVYISLGEFGDIYESFADVKYPFVPQVS